MIVVLWCDRMMRDSTFTMGGTTATPKIALAVLVAAGFVVMFLAFPKSYSRTGVDGWWVRAVAWSAGRRSARCSCFLLVRSPWGRLLRGIREDEDAMRSLGKNVFAMKMQALIIGGLFGALGGMVYVLPARCRPTRWAAR